MINSLDDNDDLYYRDDDDDDDDDDDEDDEDDLFEVAVNVLNSRRRESGDSNSSINNNNNQDELVKPEEPLALKRKIEPDDDHVKHVKIQARPRHVSNHNNSMSKASHARLEFWTMMNFCTVNSIPIPARTASGKYRDTVLFTSYKETDKHTNKYCVMFYLRIRDKLSGVLLEEYKNNVAVMFSACANKSSNAVSAAKFVFDLDMTDSDVIMHVRSQGKRDKPGTVTGPTNCFAAKLNGSKYNSKPVGNTLVVQMPNPDDYIKPYLEKRAYFENVSDKLAAACFITFTNEHDKTVSGGTFMIALTGYDKAENIFTIKFDKSRRAQLGDVWFAHNPRPQDTEIDGVNVVENVLSPVTVVHIQSDKAFMRTEQEAGCVIFRVYTVKSVPMLVKVTISAAKLVPKADNSKLIENIPQIVPYVFV